MIFDDIIEDQVLFYNEVKVNTVLWILHANKVPPHIGISTKDKFYSLKSNGKDNGIEISSLQKILKLKKVPTLCITLNAVITNDALSFEFEKFSNTIPNEVSCLTPIKNVLEVYSAKSLHELLETLSCNKLIKSTFGLNLPIGFNQIQDYNEIDINNRLLSLNIKQQKISIVAMNKSHIDVVLEIENDTELWKVSKNDSKYVRDDIVNLELSLRNTMECKQARWMIYYESDIAGTIDLFDINNCKAGVGVFVKSEFRLKNIASNALKLVEIEARKLKISKITANVHSDNISSLRVFEKNNYKKMSNLTNDESSDDINLEKWLKS